MDRPLSYTGHPFVDVGLATMMAFVGKQRPEELVSDDLKSIAAYMKEMYVQDPLRSFFTVVFPNSGFTQPAYAKTPGKRQLYAEHVLGAWEAETLASNDAFLDAPVADVSYDVDGKLGAGRADRRHIPLLTGQAVINFGAEGEPGLLVSGLAMLAIQAFPLGCLKCAGRLLAVHSDNPDILLYFANAFLTQNRLKISLARAANSKKLDEASHSPMTALVHTLLSAEHMRGEALADQLPFSVTAYHISNSGQGPSLDIYHLPSQTIDFLRTMHRDPFATPWSAIAARGWQRPRNTKEGDAFEPKYNTLYEDLFRLPDEAPRFIRTYFLRAPRRMRDKQDPRSEYSAQEEAGLVSWVITEEFLKGVLSMNAERVHEIRDMGDSLAQYVAEQNDQAFLRTFYRTRSYADLRTILIRANMANLRRGAEPLVKFDPFITVFEEGEELPHINWQLARDLVLIRMIERLHDLGWLRQHQESIAGSGDDEAEDNE